MCIIIFHTHHHYFSALQQVLGIQTLHCCLSSALLFILTYDPSFSSSIIPILCLPRGLLPSILPSSTSFSKLFPLTMWPIQFFFRFSIVITIFLSFSTK